MTAFTEISEYSIDSWKRMAMKGNSVMRCGWHPGIGVGRVGSWGYGLQVEQKLATSAGYCHVLHESKRQYQVEGMVE